jgi:ACT domain-containing protein
MAQKELAMEAKLLAALTAEVSVPVPQLCAELGISRQSFYKYRRRFAEEAGQVAVVLEVSSMGT